MGLPSKFLLDFYAQDDSTASKLAKWGLSQVNCTFKNLRTPLIIKVGPVLAGNTPQAVLADKTVLAIVAALIHHNSLTDKIEALAKILEKGKFGLPILRYFFRRKFCGRSASF